MNKNTTIRARINDEIKKEASDVLKSIGLTPSDAIRMMLIRVAREKALPFDPLIPNAETIAAMEEARNGQVKSFDDVDSLMSDLNAED